MPGGQEVHGEILITDNTTIRFTIGRCSLGQVLVASSARGTCAILLGDKPGPLTRELQTRFPDATLTADHAGLRKLLEQAARCVDSPATGFKPPLDLRGTQFQQRVWQALRRIPAGKTASYADVARRIGAPKAARAVAAACAANALAVAVPCHRVVRSDGGLSGYRWGVERKRALLDREARC